MVKGIETERKFVIERPSLDVLRACDGYTVSRITQTYLTSLPNVTHRVRARTFAESTVYTETKKIRLSPMSAIEEEETIDEQTYRARCQQIKEGTRPIEKTRHTFRYAGHTVEIDIYPEWTRRCILEVELASEAETLALPSFLKIVREVTGDRAYSNAAMARSFPEECV